MGDLVPTHYTGYVDPVVYPTGWSQPRRGHT